MNQKIIRIFIVLSMLIAGLSSGLYAKSPDPKAVSDTALQNEVLININQYRKQHGLAPLTMNNKMVNEAKQHSIAMATHKIPFGHSNFQSRIKRLHAGIKNSGAGAENVAYNYKNAHEVVKNWLLSPGHKRNIDGNYNITGIGIARDSRGKLYYTQIFLNTKGNQIQTSRRSFRAFLHAVPWNRHA